MIQDSEVLHMLPIEPTGLHGREAVNRRIEYVLHEHARQKSGLRGACRAQVNAA